MDGIIAMPMLAGRTLRSSVRREMGRSKKVENLFLEATTKIPASAMTARKSADEAQMYGVLNSRADSYQKADLCQVERRLGRSWFHLRV